MDAKTWALKEQDKARIMPTEMKFMRGTAKYTSQDYKTNEDILSKLKINPVLKKIQNHRNKKRTTCSANGHTDRLPHLIMKYQPCGK